MAEEDKEQRKLKFKLELQEKETEAKIAENTAGIVEAFNILTYGLKNHTQGYYMMCLGEY